MDANKLLEIIQLLEADERDFTIGNRIEEIRNLIAQNSEEQSQTIEDKLKELYTAIRSSRAAIFSNTELLILEKIDAGDYFGKPLLTKIDEITSTSKTYELQIRFKEFQSQRAEKYSKMLQMRNVMIDNGVEAYRQEANEVALSIPGDDVPVSDTAKYLEDFSMFLRTLQDCNVVDDVRPESAKIVRASKGSLNFFALVDPETIRTLLDILADLAAVYVATGEIRRRSDKTALTETEINQVDKVYEDIAKKRVEDFVNKTAEKACKKDDNELRNRVRTHLRMLLKWIPMGIHIEVVVQKSVEPVDEKREGKALKAKQHETKVLAAISEMYSLPAEKLMLPGLDEVKAVPEIETPLQPEVSENNEATTDSDDHDK